MKSIDIPVEEQIMAILDGSIYDVVCKYVKKTSLYDIRDYLAIDKKVLIDYFKNIPKKRWNILIK